MALFDNEFNEYRAKNESFEKTWMASSVNDVAKWAFIFGVLSLVPTLSRLINDIYRLITDGESRLLFKLYPMYELTKFGTSILSLIATFLLISFAFKFKKAFKEGDETACIRQISLLKSFFIWLTFILIFGFCAEQILHFFSKSN
jgi:hypothetical protein